MRTVMGSTNVRPRSLQCNAFERTLPSVITEEEAKAIAQLVRRTTSADFSIRLGHFIRAITRMANGNVLLSNDGEFVLLSLALRLGTSLAIVELNQFDEATIRAGIRHAEAVARANPWRTESVGIEHDGPRTYLAVPTWKESTLAAMTGAESVRDTALPAILDTVAAESMRAAGALGFIASAMYVHHSSGLEAYHRETDVVCSVTARSPNGKSSGWAGTASRDWSTLDVRAVARNAAEIAKRAVNPVALEPGRRTAILSATAFGQLFKLLAGAFDAQATDRGMTLFSKSWRGGNRLGMRVMDERIRMWSDPTDPVSSHVPFWNFGLDAAQIDRTDALPLGPMTWIEGGVLQSLAYGVRYSAARGKPYNRYPYASNVGVMPGTKTMTVDEMIANCQEGVFVNRFSNLSGLDARTGLSTGVTRDGCFLIKDGKILKPIKNFRILESPLFVVNNIEAIGTPQRVVVDDGMDAALSAPIVVPPVMVRDFNFSALSDAI